VGGSSTKGKRKGKNCSEVEVAISLGPGGEKRRKLYELSEKLRSFTREEGTKRRGRTNTSSKAECAGAANILAIMKKKKICLEM